MYRRGCCLELHKLYGSIRLLELGKMLANDEYMNVLDSKIKDNYVKLNEFYYRCTFNKMDINNSDDLKKLFNWAKENSRYDLLNDLFDNVLYTLLGDDCEEYSTVKDLFLVANVKSILQIVNDEMLKHVNSEVIQKIDLSKMTRDEVNSCVRDILLEIDGTGKWSSIYDELLNNHKIIILNELSSSEYDEFLDELTLSSLDCVDNALISTYNDKYILLTDTGTIMDVIVTIHEFVHYINHLDSCVWTKILTLEETFSIFYQLYAIDYLDRNGISKCEINYLRQVTNENVLIDEDVYDKFLIFKEYASLYIHKGYISADDDLKKNDYDLDVTYMNCDKINDMLIMNDTDILDIYMYVIGDYLADKLMSVKDEKLMSIINDYVFNMKELDPYEVFKLIDCKYDIRRIPNNNGVKKVLKK